MNILFFTSTIPDVRAGGVESVTLKLRKIFQDAGHNVYGLCKFPAKDSTYSAGNFFIFPDTDGRVISEKNILFARNFCREKDIDIIINNAVHHEFILLGQELRSEKIKVISCWHSAPDILSADMRDRYVGILYNKGIKKYSQLLKYLIKSPLNFVSSRSWFRKKFYEMYEFSDACVLLFQAFFDDFKRIAQIRDMDKLCAIPNPINYKGYMDNREKKEIILWLGRMEFSAKRPDLMLKVWPRVGAGNPDWELWMCGDGPAKQLLEEYCIRKKIRNIKFLGQVKAEEIYPQASVFCMTSSYEGFGMVAVEAVAHRLPIVAFNYPVLSELAVDGGNSIFIPPFSIKRFARSLDELMKSPDKRNSMANFDQSYLEKFSPDQVRKQWELLFERLKAK